MSKAKTYELKQRSNEIADRILSKSKQLLSKSYDKKYDKRSKSKPSEHVPNPRSSSSPTRSRLHDHHHDSGSIHDHDHKHDGALSLLNPDDYK